MENSWVDFKAIKQTVRISQILDHYGLKLKKSGKELRGKCPIHQGEGSDTLHVNIDKNVFHCFSCGAKGNILDFVCAMENCSLRDAGRKLQDWFSVMPGIRAPEPMKPTNDTQLTTEKAGERGEPNKPLDFRLQGVNYQHPYLAGRGIDPETAEYFGVGYFSGRGSMSGRIVIPIENEHGELLAYAGRSIDGSAPKYKFPAGFKKSQVLYNLGRALEDDSAGAVVLVEGFFDCIRVVQAGHVCVALMGCSLSGEQEALLVRYFRQVVIILDGDEAGRNAAGEIGGRLAHKTWVRVVDVQECKQPDQLSKEELQALLGTV